MITRSEKAINLPAVITGILDEMLVTFVSIIFQPPTEGSGGGTCAPVRVAAVFYMHMNHQRKLLNFRFLNPVIIYYTDVTS